MSCAEIRDSAPELVLGTLDGAERAMAVAHLTGCADCRGYVEELTRVVDALALTGPVAEPPAGFESRVLKAVKPQRRWRFALTAAAAVLVILVAIVALPRPHARQFAGPMRDRHGSVVGEAVIGGGSRPFVFVAIEGWGESGAYRVEVVTRSGRHVDVAPIRLDGGRGSGGGALPVAFGEVRTVWVTDAEHDAWCSASVV